MYSLQYKGTPKIFGPGMFLLILKDKERIRYAESRQNLTQ